MFFSLVCQVTVEQWMWINLLTAYGHYATVAYGWEQAVTIINAYLEKPPMTPDLLPEYEYTPETFMHDHPPPRKR